MERFNFIDYHQKRDFSRKFNATFEFLRQNFKGLSKSILFISGPPILIVSLLMGSFFSDFFSMAQNSSRGGGDTAILNYFTSANFWLQVVLMVVLLTVSTVMVIATINNYILLYEEQRTNKIEVHDVWIRVRQTFWMYFGTMFMFMFLGFVAYIVLIIPFALISAIAPLLIFLGMLVLLGGLTYLAIGASLTFFIRAYERKGFFDALGRSFNLIKGKWWSTFGIVFILYLIIMIVSYIFLIPWYVVIFVTTLHSTETGGPAMETYSTIGIIGLILFTLYYLVQMILYSIPNIGVAFQYFNLVELKEAKSLLGQIESLGQDESNAGTHHQDEHY